MNKLIKVSKVFEGHSITTFTYNQRPCWIAREVGDILGYSRGGERLITNITKEWRNEFIDEQDLVVVTGEELSQFKELLKDHTESVGSFTSRIMLLFETGLYLALTKTNKPVGVRLRRFLATEVLPQIARDGHYLPDHTVVDMQLNKGSQAALRRLEIAEAREARLSRKQKEDSMNRLVDELKKSGMYSKEVIMAYVIAASELGTEKDFSTLKPKNPEEDWVSPTQIAERLGVSAQRVGRVISALNLRGNITGLAKAIVNKACGHDKTVTSYLYSPEAVRMVEQELCVRPAYPYLCSPG